MKLLVALLLLGSPLAAESGWDATLPVADSVSVEKQLADMQDSLTQARKELSKLKKEYDKLKEDNSTNHVKLLQESYQQAAQALKDLRDSLAAQSGELDAVREELAQMKDVKEQWFKQLVATAQHDWLTRSFSSIDPDALEASIVVYDRYASESPALRQSADQLRALLDKCRTYQRACRTLDQEYNPGEVSRMSASIESLLNSESDASRKQELEDVYKKLNNYWARVARCQKLIRSIDESIQSKDKSLWRDFVDLVINDEEAKTLTLTAINSIPWLKDQFEKYRAAVLEKGTEPNEYRTRILGLTAK